ncbi:uncharacterized protein LOC141700708 [Apium graveolens]|uniref:uncharacterized protein LOC141700708 n=1 Tax=Apium graveolens TaxID=4045 RepID=UPI003D7BC8FC
MLIRRKKGTSSQINKRKSIDEIKHYLDGRYVCASEAMWRILGFDIHYQFPTVKRLPIHVEGGKNVTFNINDNMEEVAAKEGNRISKLEAWFIANKNMPTAREYTYQEFPRGFTWQPGPCKWKQRERGINIGRLIEGHTLQGDTFYLRMLMLRNKGATSFKDVRTIDRQVYPTYKEACKALGLLKDDNKWHSALRENSDNVMPQQLRAMFVFILTNYHVADPQNLWANNWRPLSEDILYMKKKNSENQELTLSDHDLENYTLACLFFINVEKLLNGVSKSLRDYPNMPFPEVVYMHSTSNHLIEEETSYDKSVMKEQHEKYFNSLNEEQSHVYNSVMDSINNGEGQLFFVYGSGGCGKTFLWNTLYCRLRSEGKIVFHVVSSGIAAILLPGGRGKNEGENHKIAEFSSWVLNVGDGKVANIHPDNTYLDPEIVIPKKILIEKFTNSVKSIIDVTYPDFVNRFTSDSYLEERTIMTPTNAIIDQVNSQVLTLTLRTTHTYLSQDSIDDESLDTKSDYKSSFPIEYLNSINMPSIPKHESKLKVGVMVMLMRNLNQIVGLCNGTRMVLTRCLKNSVECKILTGSHACTKHLIPRIEMEPTDTNFMFVFKRIQFPLQICFAMTIDKS